MYKCRCCKELFTEPSIYYEPHGFTDGQYEELACCPCCGGDYIEVPDEVDDEEVDDDC